MTDILQSPLSPTQERGSSSLSGTIIHDTITNALGEEVKIRIEFTLVADMIVEDLDYHTYGNNSIPKPFLKEIVQDIIEGRNGHTLIFQS